MPRIMNELIDESLRLLDDPSPKDVIESIHETRKNCKKGRGLARLVRPALGKHFKPVNRDNLGTYPEVSTHLCTYSGHAPSLVAMANAVFGEAEFPGRLPVAIPGLHPSGHGLQR